MVVQRNLRHVAERSHKVAPVPSRSTTITYRAIQSFAATTREDGRFVTVRKGTLLIIEGPLKQFGLVEAICAEQSLLVFTRDIENCAECVSDSLG